MRGSLFEFYGDVDIYINIIFIVGIILYVAVAKFSQAVDKFSLPVDHCKNSDVVFFTHFIIVCPKSGSSMYDTRTVFSGYKIS